MADTNPESKIDLSAVIAPHLGAPGRGLEGPADSFRQSIFEQRVAAERQATPRSPRVEVDARTIQQQSLAARRAEGSGIRLWHIALGTTALAGVLVASKYMLSQPAQAEQLPVYPTPVSTQQEQGGILDNIPGFSDIANAFGEKQ